MVTSKYFNNFSDGITGEQRLMEDLIVESIRIKGHDCQYMQREQWDSMDHIFGEAPNSKFKNAFTIEMYIENVTKFGGDGEIFSKFGYEVRNTINLICSKRGFNEAVSEDIMIRPREGDLIYVPVMKDLFEIKFVNEKNLFYQFGKKDPYMYELNCEWFRYSAEDLETENQEIDQQENDLAYTLLLNLGIGSGTFIISEIVTNGNTYAEVQAFDTTAKQLQLINISGEFTANSNVIGTLSNSNYNIVSIKDKEDLIYYDTNDNSELETEANAITITTEIDPLGSP